MAKKKNAAQRRAEMQAQKPKYKKAETKQEKPLQSAQKEMKSLGKPAAKLKDIDFSRDFTLRVELLSPLHLGSGQADVNVDAQVIHDRLGLPYFPGRRLKGLLYESGLEVAEMAELSKLPLLTKAELDSLFQRGTLGAVQLQIANLYLEEHEKMAGEWHYLEERYPELFRPEDVLESYTSLRYQTRIDPATGTAADTSLHNMQVLDEGLVFSGTLGLKNGDLRSLSILALAVRNLTQAGLKRSRGFGRLACTLEQGGRDVMQPLLKWAADEARGGEAK